MPKFRLSVEDFDHPIVFLLLLSLALIPIMALWGVVFKHFGLPGPASLIK